MSLISRRPSRRVVVSLLVGALVVVVAILVVFQPQKLFYDKTVNEALPAGVVPAAVAAAPSQATVPTTTAAPSVSLPTQAVVSAAPASPTPALSAPRLSAPRTSAAPATTPFPRTTSPRAVVPTGPTVLGTGGFSSREHHTTGTATVLRLSDGSRVLRLQSLDTSNGPDLHVYLTGATADARGSAFGKDYVSLGTLKGNKGNQNYPVPAGVDLGRYHSVVIWCKRFAVPFGVAPLQR